MEQMNLIRYEGSGLTTTWTRVFICVIFALWGAGIAFFSFERYPTRMHAEYKRALAEAREAGQDTKAIPKPSDSELWTDGVPEWTVFGCIMALIGLGALAEPLWRRPSAPSPEEDTGQ